MFKGDPHETKTKGESSIYKYEKQQDREKSQPQETTLTLNDWLHQYLFDYKKGNITDNSLSRYISLWNNHIKPYKIASMKITSIKTVDMQRHIQNLLNNKRSIKTIKKVKEFISTSFNFAISIDILQTNKVRYALLPKDRTIKEHKNKIEFLEKEEQKNIIENLPDNAYGFAIILDFNTGLRLGELLALTWKDIKLDTCTLTVNKTLAQSYVFDHDGEKTYQKKSLHQNHQVLYEKYHTQNISINTFIS